MATEWPTVWRFTHLGRSNGQTSERNEHWFGQWIACGQLYVSGSESGGKRRAWGTLDCKWYLRTQLLRYVEHWSCFSSLCVRFTRLLRLLTPSRFCIPLVSPRIVPFHFGEEPANFGESANINCNVMVGDFPIDIVWLLNGEPINDYSVSTAKMGKRLSILNIDSVRGQHAGNYTCRASNSAGIVEYSSALIVNGI